MGTFMRRTKTLCKFYSLLVLGNLLFAAPAISQEFFNPVELSAINGANGFTLNQDNTLAVDVAIAGVGDVNGDGLDDILFGNAAADVGSKAAAGVSYIIYGQKGGISSPLAVSAINGGVGFLIHGIEAGDRAGFSVASAGDVNADGLPDFLIGAIGVAFGGESRFGATYVVFGKPTKFPAILELSSLDGSNGFRILGESTGDDSGYSVAGLGDVNGDGIDDIGIGAPFAGETGLENSGRGYVVFGKNTDFGASLSLGGLDGSNGFRMLGAAAADISGTTIAGAGDVNGDGFQDVIIGAFGNDPGGRDGAGAAHVVFGKDTAFAASINLGTLDGTSGFHLNGVTASDSAGDAVAGIGDFNSDGIDDVLIGAKNADPGGRSKAGTSYVFFGHNGSFSTDVELANLDGSTGFAANGDRSEDISGFDVGSAGDLNGDGVPDLIIGSKSAGSNGHLSTGVSHVLFGHANPFDANIELSALDGTTGITINGADTFDESGRRVAPAGDFDGDGVDDVMLAGSRKTGSHVLYGISSSAGLTTVFSSVLPAARSGFVGGPDITVFATAINAGSNRADTCTFDIAASDPVTLTYQPTNSANVAVGPANTFFQMNPGAAQSFILSFTPVSTNSGIDVFPQITCDTAQVAAITGVNTVFLSIDSVAVPDILSIAATPLGDGIIHVPADSISFMSVSATNIGVGDTAGSADAAITVSVDDGPADLNLLFQVCETDALGTCTSALGSSVATTIGAGPSFFAVFVSDQSSGGIALDPANSRVFLRFTDSGGTVRSVTSAAVTVP
jgi:hypothetical protein